MIGAMVRWFGRGAESRRSVRGSVSARRFTPQMETLETRAIPGGVPGGVVTGSLTAALLGAKVAGPSQVTVLGSQPTGIEIFISRSSGEEIPQ